MSLQTQGVHGFEGIEPSGTGGDEQELGLFRSPVPVEGRGFVFFLDLFQFQVQGQMAQGGGDGDEDLGGVITGLLLFLRELSQDHVAPGMGDPGYASDHDQAVDGLGQFKSELGHVLRFLEGGRLHQREIAQLGDEAGVFFVGGRKGRGIIGRDQNQPAGADPGKVQVQDEIRGDVDPVLLHRAQSAQTGKRGGRSGFERHFFVDRPFYVNFQVLGHLRQGPDDLRGGVSGVSRRELHPGLQGSAGDGLVPHQKLVGSRSVFFDYGHFHLLNTFTAERAETAEKNECNIEIENAKFSRIG